jgi:hypothetical protein
VTYKAGKLEFVDGQLDLLATEKLPSEALQKELANQMHVSFFIALVHLYRGCSPHKRAAAVNTYTVGFDALESA